MTNHADVVAGGVSVSRDETIIVARGMIDPSSLVMRWPAPHLSAGCLSLLRIIADAPTLSQHSIAWAVRSSVGIIDCVPPAVQRDIVRLADAAARLTTQEIAAGGSLASIIASTRARRAA